MGDRAQTPDAGDTEGTGVLMPRLSDSMQQGTILRWLKSEGEGVAPGEELVEIETDKSSSIYEAEAGGELEILAAPGETRAVGELIARLGATVTPPAADEGGGLAEAPASGTKRPAAKGEVEVVELGKAGQSMARRVAESKAIVPHLYLSAEADLEAVGAQADRGAGTRELVIAAAARALREHPEVNSSYRDGRIERYSRINVGFVVAADEAVVVVTVFDADSKSPAQIGAELDQLCRAVAERSVTPPQMSGGTFTVTDLGQTGVERLATIVNPPQAASLAVGAPRTEPVVSGDGVRPGRRLTLSLSCDHRVLHAEAAAGFLARVRDLVTDPGPLRG